MASRPLPEKFSERRPLCAVAVTTVASRSLLGQHDSLQARKLDDPRGHYRRSGVRLTTCMLDVEDLISDLGD